MIRQKIENSLGYRMAVRRVAALAAKFRRQAGWTGLDPQTAERLRWRAEDCRLVAARLRCWYDLRNK